MSSIYVALSEVMDDVRSVGKKERNNQQNFNFRGIDAVVNAVGPVLRKHGVVVVPTVLEHELKNGVTSKGNNIMQCTVRVKYTFYGPEGDSLEAVVPGESMDSGDKSTAKAMSVAFRTALLQTLTLPTTESDPDAESYNVGRGWTAEQIKARIQVHHDDADALRQDYAEAAHAGTSKELLDALVVAGKAAQGAVLEGTVTNG